MNIKIEKTLYIHKKVFLFGKLFYFLEDCDNDGTARNKRFFVNKQVGINSQIN